MPQLPPPVWAELLHSGAWQDITEDVRVTTGPVTVTRGLSSESSSAAEPTSCTCDLDSRDDRYAPRNPNSPLYGLIGRNTPFRFGYEVGSPWADLPGSAGNALTTATSPALAVGDLDLRMDIAPESWEAGQGLAARYVSTGDNRAWALALAGTGQLTFYWSPNGTLASRVIQFSTVPVKAYNGQRLTVRVTLDVDNGAGGYELRFYTGRTVNDSEWALLGDPIVGTSTTAVFTAVAPMELGVVSGLAIDPMRGKLYAAKLLNGGTVVATMETADGAPGAASVTSGGRVWTLAGGASLTNRHIRMAGEVPAWPPTRDLSGNDNIVSINPSGLMRRMDAGNRPQDSTLLRYIKANAPIECWPLTDGPRSTYARSLVGGQNMQQKITAGLDTAGEWQAGRLAEWIEPVMSVKANTTGALRGDVPRSTSAATGWSVDLFLSGGGTPSAGQWTISDYGSGSDSAPQNRILVIFAGSVGQLTIIRETYSTVTSSSALLANIAADIYNEQPHHLRLSVQMVGADTLWMLYVDGALAGSGTITSITMKAAKTVLLGWGYSTLAGITMTDRSFGFITYWDSSGPSAANLYNAYTGFQGERAGARIERLAAEAGYTVTVAGEEAGQQRMGIQGQKKLLELLNEASRTNFGYLLDARDRIEVIHRGNSTLWNQPPALTLDYNAGLISPPFRPVDDDRLTENDVSVKREYGSYPATAVLEEGALSVLPPEEGGVGRYDTEYTYSLYTDEQAAQVAYMRLHLGTYAGVRYTRITLNLANERVFAHVADILRVDVGDLLRLTNLPADHGPDDVDVLVAGYTEDAGPNGWTVTFNCVPAEPWTTGIVGMRVVEDFEDTTYAVGITAGGALPWTRTNLRSYTGSWSLRAGAITNNQTSDAVIAVPFGATRLTVAYRVSSEASGPGFEGDRLLVLVDGVQVLRAQGEVAWQHLTVDVAGKSSVTFRYAKDNSGATGDDTAWIDNVTFTDATDSRADTSGCVLAAGLDATATSVAVTTTGEARWVDSATYPDDFPFDVRTGGEVMRVTACTGTTASQTFTVTRGINGVTKSHASGQDIRLARPVYVAL